MGLGDCQPWCTLLQQRQCKAAGSSGLAAGQQEMDEAQRLFAKLQAAVYLYELTGDVSYKNFVESNYTSIIADHGPTQ